MSEQTPPATEPTNPTKQAAVDLLQKKRLLAIQAATIQSQLRAIDQSLAALRQTASGETIHLELTKDDAGLLMGVCCQYANLPEVGRATGELIDKLGKHIFNALYQQNADFAERVRVHFGGPSTSAPTFREPADDSASQKLPKKLRPYLKYTDEQIKAAWEKSALACERSYYAKGYVRLYLTRTALVEMYRQPRHLAVIYAAMLKGADTHERTDSIAPLCPCGPYEPLELQNTERFKPYDQLNEREMRKAMRTLGISHSSVKPAYGFFGLTMRRETVFQFYKRSPHLKSAVAYLLRLFDELVAKGTT